MNGLRQPSRCNTIITQQRRLVLCLLRRRSARTCAAQVMTFFLKPFNPTSCTDGLSAVVKLYSSLVRPSSPPRGAALAARAPGRARGVRAPRLNNYMIICLFYFLMSFCF